MKDLWKWCLVISMAIMAIMIWHDNRRASLLWQQVDVLRQRTEAAEKETAEIKSHVVDLGNMSVWVSASIHECGCAHKDQSYPEEP